MFHSSLEENVNGIHVLNLGVGHCVHGRQTIAIEHQGDWLRLWYISALLVGIRDMAECGVLTSEC
jgi:hypothetical protein